ncbi:MAG: DEAD/DEAH box helicase family protein [Nostoc sp.]
MDAVVVRSGTASKLQRAIPNDSHIFSYYRHLIVSLDYAKSERRRASFITHCPDFVIVDEAHTCTHFSSNSTSGQQRHQLIQQIAEKKDRHLLLLSATPHSGIEQSFLSLLGLLQPEFEQLLNSPKHQSLLAEECAVVGFTGAPSNPIWLTPENAKSLLEQANPVGDAPLAIKQAEIEEVLSKITDLESDLELFARERSHSLSQSHRRVRAITQEGQIQVKPQLPMDILGVYILQPGKIRNTPSGKQATHSVS